MNINKGRNILFIGNGFDRLMGLQTDYISWIDYEMIRFKNDGYTYEDIIMSLLWEPSGSDIIEYTVKGEKKFQRTLSRKKIYKTNHDDLVLKQNSWILYIYIVLYYPPDTKMLEMIEGYEQEYGLGNALPKLINMLRENDVINYKGNWIDIEKLIEYTIFEDSAIISIITHNNDKKCLDDFLDMKRLLSEYIDKEIKGKDFDHKIYTKFRNVDYIFESEIVSFNYTTILTNYIVNRGIENPNLHSESIEISLHGKSSDSELIVFGANNKKNTYNIRQEPKDFFKNKYFEYTKMYQLQVLNSNRKFSFDIYNIENVYVLGHSISPQDYNYFFSLIDSNPNTIKFILLYYTYENNDGKLTDNKKETIEAMYKMLETYEMYSEQNISYKLNFEGRIKFQDIKSSV